MSNCARNAAAVFTTTPVATATHLEVSGEQCASEALSLLENFWPNVMIEMRNLCSEDFKTVELPLARIKKIMKLDEDVKMISAETPVLLAKAAEIFIQELTLRSWVHTEESRRRTLQRNDVATAISKCDQFDFLIDIVPREEANKPATRRYSHSPNTSMTPVSSTSSDVQYVITLPQTVSTQPNQILQLTGQQPLVQVDPSTTPQIIQLPSSQAIQIHFTQPSVDEKPGTAILQVYGSENELISLTPQQLQQLFSNNANQPTLILQTPGETQQQNEP